MTNNSKKFRSVKKVIGCALSFSMAFSAMSTAFAFDIDEALRGTNYEEAAHVLGSLGIMVGDPDGSFRAEDGLKRSEFAKIAVHALGLEESAEAAQNRQIFNDVATDYWANGYINVAHEQGIVIGDPNGDFRPEDEILYQEAATVLVRMAGYEPAADAKGGYPQGYLSVANQYGFTKNATGSATSVIKRGVVANMTNNTLTIGIMEQTGFGSNTNFEITDKTILKQHLDTEKLSGQVTANYFTSLKNSAGLEKGNIEIDNVIYKTTDNNAQNLLGQNVDYYLQTKNNESIVILALSQKGKNEVMLIAGDDIESVSDNKINYWKNKDTDSTTKNVRYEADALMIHNGISKDFDSSLIKGNGELRGEIALLDNDSNGIYDIIFVNEYKNLVVESTSKLSYTISDKYGNKSLQLDPENSSLKFVLQNEGGAEVEFDDLKEWQVISYLGSNEDGVVIATVTEKVVEGTISEVRDDEFKIGDKFYKVADNYTDSINLDDTGLFYLDIMGRIAAVDAEASLSGNYSYLINATASTDMNDYIKLKLFTKDGTIKIFETTEKVKFNGTTKITSAEALKKLQNSDGEIVKQMVTFETNADGKITRINTAKDITSDTIKVDKENFVKNYESDKAVYNKTSGKLGLVKVTDSTIIFDIPKGADEEDYAIKDKSMLDHDGEYDVEVFDVTEDLSAKVILVKNSTGIANVESPVAVINKITTTTNSKGEKVEKVYVAYNGEMTSFETSEAGVLVNEEGKQLSNGDIIQFRTNSSGAIDKITVLFEVKNKGTEFTKTDGDMSIYYGRVEKKFSDSINLSVNGKIENFSIKDAKVVSVDTEKTSNTVSIASAGDIQKYDELSPRRVFVRVYDDVVQEIIIVK